MMSNCIIDDGFSQICNEALSYGVFLERMGLKFNQIGEDGCEALLEVFQNSQQCSTNVDISGILGIRTDLLQYTQHLIRNNNT